MPPRTDIDFMRMALEHVFDKALANAGVRARVAGAQHHKIHHLERRHQLRTRPLPKQRL